MSGEAINPAVPPSGDGCVECLQAEGWWFHLRRCAHCGHVGCCDSSPGGHARKHWEQTGHNVMQSFEPGEDWFWNFSEDSETRGPALAPPHAHPQDQPVPGPQGKVPHDWRRHLR